VTIDRVRAVLSGVEASGSGLVDTLLVCVHKRLP
jgi:hypothetical protein